MEERKTKYNSPSEISDHLKITYVPTYLLATAVALLIGHSLYGDFWEM